MSSKKKTATTTTATETAASAPAATTVEIIKVIKADAKYRSGSIRDAWYQRALQYDGKPVSEFLAVGDKGLTQFTTRSKHPGDPHGARGYLGGLLRRKVVQVVQVPVKQ